MYILADEPEKGGALADVFDALDDAFGTDEFSEDQAVSAIALGLSVDDTRASQLFKNMNDRGFVSEV